MIETKTPTEAPACALPSRCGNAARCVTGLGAQVAHQGAVGESALSSK